MIRIQSDPARTARRLARLEEYVHRNLIADGTFICQHHEACRASRPQAFYEGQLSHVGKHYDLTVNGRDVRIVIVGQEYGQHYRLVSLRARTTMIEGSAALKFGKRNPHMAGTTSILRLLLGREAGAGRKGEGLFTDRAQPDHIFDGFALVNALLCTALKEPPTTGAGKGYSSGLMRRRCPKTHFRPTMEILEPTVIVAEGQGVRRWIARALGLPPRPRSSTLDVADLPGRPEVLTFDHPSAPGSGWWGRSSRSEYLTRVVAPAIRGWRYRTQRTTV
ncbi:MAG: hypothetical protein OXE96_16130 [Gemmatimonadetes bacterium]|nr:hypothetical protein [Gemmatimonadota bacterium]